MRRSERHALGKSTPDLVEETVHLLRVSPARVLAVYYVGSLPFVLGLLYFWTDMSRSPFANQHLAEAGLAISGAFLWMKTCQAVFANQLLETLTGNSTPLSLRRCVRIFVAQATLQPTALFLVPLASVPLLPLAWVYAFYQNATVFAADEAGSTRALVKRAWRQSALWPRQNHALLAVLSAFGFFVFVNWVTVLLALPVMLKTLFGIESIFSRSPLSMLNTTFFAVAAGLTYLCVDPIVKGAYVLRCFYGESLQSGADLRSELKRVGVTVPALILLLWAFCPAWANAGGADPAADTPVALERTGAANTQDATIAPPQLDRAISDVLRERKYAWRSPREKLAEEKPASRGIIGRFLDRALEVLKDWGKSVLGWVERLLRKLFGQAPNPAPAAGFGWVTRLHLLIYLLAAAALVGIILLIRHLLQNRKARLAPVAAEAIQRAVDLAGDDVAPDQLPEDGWTQMAHELLARGELRLALRAFYLASLAHLAARNLITIARFKSNREYERELSRRGHSLPDLLTCFSDNVAVFERSWYGTHPVDDGLVNEFAVSVNAMRTVS